MLLADRYDLVRRIGSGGMATVWEAQDTVLKRTVAVKVVDLAADGDPTLGERLRREAVTTASLSHPDIVTVYDAGVAGRTAYVVMALVEGRDLTAVLAEHGPLPVAEAARVGARVAGALAAAHAGGIVHRDIKPANVLVDDDRVTVVDFGIASMSGSALAGLTATGSLIGTAHYMAPEQAGGHPASPASDVYALGCLLTTLLTGAPPFEGENPMVVLQSHLMDAPAPLRDRRPDVAPELALLVAAMLAKDPAERPTAPEVRDRLAAIETTPDAAPTAVLNPPRRTAVLPSATPATPLATPPATPPTRAFPAPTPALPAVIPPRGAGPVPPTGARPSPTGPPARRRRRTWVLPTVLATVLIALALVAASLDRADPDLSSGTPAGDPAATTPGPSAPVESTPAETQPATEPPAQPADVGALIAALDADEAVKKDLADRWTEVTDALEEGKQQKAARKVRELSHRIDELARDGQLTADDAAALQAAIDAATATLPAAAKDD